MYCSVALKDASHGEVDSINMDKTTINNIINAPDRMNKRHLALTITMQADTEQNSCHYLLKITEGNEEQSVLSEHLMKTIF